MIAVLHGQGVYTDESTPLLTKLHRWRVAQGLRHVAIVHSADSLASRSITEFQFDSIYEGEPGNLSISRYFETEAEAWKWLEELGYCKF